MKRLGFASEREMQLQCSIANQELAPSAEFCGKVLQLYFVGGFQQSRRYLFWQVLPHLQCAACFVPHNTPILINPPESAAALEFADFLHEWYKFVTIRSKPKAKQKSGRPKDSEKRNGRD